MLLFKTDEILQKALHEAQIWLKDFLNSTDVNRNLLIAFGNAFDVEAGKWLLWQWLEPQQSLYLPKFEIYSSQDLKSPMAAYAGSTNTIYLSEQFLRENANNLKLIASVIVEELGHALDWQINQQDASGDEGAIFANLVQEKNLDEKALELLKAESDHDSILLNGQLIGIEKVDPGNTLSTPFNIGYLNRPKSFSEFVGSTDREDYYYFALLQNSGVSFLLNGLSDEVNLEVIYDADNDKYIDYDETLFSDYSSSSITDYLLLGKGAYFIRVHTPYSSDNTRYVLSLSQWNNLSTTPYDPGNQIYSAFNIGNLTPSSPRSYYEFVGSADVVDYYRFSLSNNSLVNLKLSGLSDWTELTLVYDANNNGNADYDEMIYLEDSSSLIDTTIPLGAGSYLVKVNPEYNSNNSNYLLTLSQTNSPTSTYTDPGNTLSSAYNLGNIVGTRTVQQFIGSTDLADCYRFNLVEIGNFSFNLYQLSDYTEFRLIYDDNNNGTRDYDETIYVDWGDDNLGTSLSLGAGTYYIEVAPDSNSYNSNYTLQLIGSADPKPHSDFNGDYLPDTLAYSPNLGQTSAWLMRGNSVFDYKNLPSWTGWKPVATGDFNRDGWTDIVVNNPSQGWNMVWFMNNLTRQSYAALPSWGANWKIIDTGDFNKDRNTDLLVYNPTSGGTAIWWMYGTYYGGYASASYRTNWETVAAGDINNDAVTDILLRNPSTGENAVHLMNQAGQLISTQSLPSWGKDWKISGTTDLNYDGATDIVVNHTTNNWNSLWYMWDNQMTGYGYFPFWDTLEMIV